MIDDTILWIVISLIGICLLAAGYVTNVLLLNLKGLKFLRDSKLKFIENDDEELAQEVTERAIPLLLYYNDGIRGMFYILFSTSIANFILLMLSTMPWLYGSFIWTFVALAAAALNAYILISFRQWIIIKRNINVICEEYNVMVQSYNFIEEYEGKDNDSTD